MGVCVQPMIQETHVGLVDKDTAWAGFRSPATASQTVSRLTAWSSVGGAYLGSRVQGSGFRETSLRASYRLVCMQRACRGCTSEQASRSYGVVGVWVWGPDGGLGFRV